MFTDGISAIQLILKSVAKEKYVLFCRTLHKTPHRNRPRPSRMALHQRSLVLREKEIQVETNDKTKWVKLYKKKDEFFDRHGNTLGDTGRERRAANAGERGNYHDLERRHDGVARARDVAVAKCADEAEGPPSADTNTDDQEACLDDNLQGFGFWRYSYTSTVHQVPVIHFCGLPRKE